MYSELTPQLVSGVFGSGYFAAVPAFLMKQHQDRLFPLSSFNARGSEHRDLIPPNHIQVIIQGQQNLKGEGWRNEMNAVTATVSHYFLSETHVD